MNWQRPITRLTQEGLALARDVAEGLIGPDSADSASQCEAMRRRFLAEVSRIVSGHDGAGLARLARSLEPDDLWATLEPLGDWLDPGAWSRVSAALGELEIASREREQLSRGSPWRRALAAKRLGILHDEDSRVPLRSAMEQGPAPVTFAAAVSLARLRDLEALRWLLEHPHATSGRRRFQIVALLCRFGPGAVALLHEALRGWEPTEPIHLATIEALGHWRGQISVPLLTGQLAGGALEARIAAARALGSLADPSAAGALIAALEDPEWQVRAQVARALGILRSEDALPGLSRRLRDDAWWVRRHASLALAELGEPGRRALGQAAGEEDSPSREMAIEVLEALDRERPHHVGERHVA